jgi:hypothetical protein
MSNERLHSTFHLQPTAYSLQPTAYSLMPDAYSLIHRFSGIRSISSVVYCII